MRKVGYKFRIYPNAQQQDYFKNAFGCHRKYWNLMLNDRIVQDEQKRQDSNFVRKYKTPASFKPDHPYLRSVDSLVGANAQMQLRQAFDNYYKNPSHFGYPSFKSKLDSQQSFTTNNQKGTVAIIDGTYLKIPKLKSHIRIKMHRQLEGVIKSTTISKTPDGKYYASILCDCEDAEQYPKTGENVGIDLGITTFAVFSSDRPDADNHRFSRQDEKRLKREERKLSKRRAIAKQNGINPLDAKNYQKQKIRVARLKRKVAQQRQDFLHQLSHSIVKNHDVIAIEDLNVQGMLKNRKLSRAISDVSWSEFVRQLVYKAEWYGRTVVKIDRWYPSSKLCATEGCDYKAEHMPLKVRDWSCPNCGTHHDRDKNASRNILSEGLQILDASA